jgi:drug/metabolite transporter (DMT)-like permease
VHIFAVFLILLSAVAHVYWNYQVKRSSEPAIYIWCLLVISTCLFALPALWISWPIAVSRNGWYCVAGSAVFLTGYFALMAQSYRRDDLSRAYPIARGVAPLATVVWGIFFHGEHPSTPGWLGIGGIALGLLILPMPRMRLPRRLTHAARLPLVGILAAVGTGLCSSGYSTVDKAGVQYVPPTLYIVMIFAGAALIQTVLLWPRHGGPAFVAEIRRGGRQLCLAAVLMLGGYLLVLMALRTEPVSYVVPLRSVSVLLTVLVGTKMLGEEQRWPRLVAATLILLGIVAITCAG